ncbi:MAG: hypothetical protein LUF91_05035 [Oscillospiraceae bacterium]|nr:hypothetical protein [Oscillospiraceae bacterium]
MSRFDRIKKTCANESCQKYHIKFAVKRDVIYCKYCGQRLQHICTEKKCFVVLSDPDAKQCDSCKQKGDKHYGNKSLQKCSNANCPKPQKRFTVENDVCHCPYCGEMLVHVCKGKNCDEILSNPKTVYCEICEKKRREDREQARETLVKITKGLPAAAAAIAATIPFLRKFIKR